MANEPEHPLEKLIRAWSAKRRRESKRFDLHPATRRLLQAEVLRQFPPAQRAPVSWVLIFRRLLGGSATVVAGVGALVALGWAVQTFWNNLPRYGDVAVNDLNPPREIDFTLRKHSEPEAAEPKLADRSSSPESPLPKPKPGAAPSSLAGSFEGGIASAPAMTQASTAKQDRTAADALAAAGRAVGDGRATARTDLAGSPFLTGSNAFAFSHVPLASGAGFDPRLSGTLATGGVAALAASLRDSTARPGRDAKSLAEGAPTNEAVGGGEPFPGGVRLASAPSSGARPASRSALPRAGAPAATAPPDAPSGPSQALQGSAPVAAAAVNREAGAETYQFVRLIEGQSGARLALADSAAPAETTRQEEVTARGPVAGRAQDSGALRGRFLVSRQGGRVTFTDADGSIYEGSITGDQSGRAGLPLKEKKSEVRKDDYALEARSAARPLAGDVPAAWGFRVGGTNATLRQRVVLEGVLEAAAAPAGMGGSAAEYGGPTGQGAARSLTGPAPVAHDTTGAAAARSKAGGSAPVGVLILRGSMQVGTNAQEPFRALRSR